jgi:hypothetical protein
MFMARLVGGMATEDVRARNAAAIRENVPVTEFRGLDHLPQSLPEMA